MNWPVVSLGEVAAIDRVSADPTTLDPSTPYVGLEDIERGGRLIGRRSIGEAQVTSNKFRFDAPHVLFGKLRPNLAKIARPNYSGVCSTDILPIRVGNRLDAGYLTHYMRQPEVVAWSASQSAGANLPRLSPNALLGLVLPLPPLDEQRRLAVILDKAESVVRSWSRAKSAADGLAGAIFDQMFGDPVRNMLGYSVRELKDWVDPRSPITYGILKPGPDEPDGVPYIRVVDIRDNEILTGSIRRTSAKIADSYRRSTVASGDLVISIRGHVGRLGVVPPSLDGANITQDSARLRIAGAAGSYVAAALETPAMVHWMAQRTKGVAVRGINIGDLRQAPVPVPPEPEIERFAAARAEVQRFRRKALKQMFEATCLARSLQQRAFSGQL
ncbi:restriction endonuclease subunit S [Klenkia sp. LSe6-5]|uniref:Restriction endonuclease subunit S n=1 Tax=Klenkia sesuvii TaxID=3103137 RepID=A0ABU8DS94_9ACTN